MKKPPNPTGKGGFKKGVSGNPGGRPKVLKEALAEERQYAPDVLRRIRIIALEEPDPRAAVVAGREFLDRTVGKPTVAVQLTGAEGGPIEVQHVDIRKLSIEQLRQLESLLAAAAGPKPGEGEGGAGST